MTFVLFHVASPCNSHASVSAMIDGEFVTAFGLGLLAVAVAVLWRHWGLKDQDFK